MGSAALAAPTFGSNIAAVEGQASGTAATLGSSPIVTAVLSYPGTVNGKTYTSWSFLANDGTGSLDIFGTLSGLGYTPTVGDAIGVTGTYSPYHQIPEIGTVTAIGATSSGNPLPAMPTLTIPQLNQTTLPFTAAGYLINLDNVTISSGTSIITPGVSTWGTSNLTLTVTDSSNNKMTLYYWPTSYAMANFNLDGITIPSGPVNITGFDSVYPSTPGSPEFTPISIVSVPEPVSTGLLAVGAAAMLMRRRRTA